VKQIEIGQQRTCLEQSFLNGQFWKINKVGSGDSVALPLISLARKVNVAALAPRFGDIFLALFGLKSASPSHNDLQVLFLEQSVRQIADVYLTAMNGGEVVGPGRVRMVERPSSELLSRWLQRHADLLIEERNVEKDEARMLLSKCSPKQLERNGLAILGLGVLNVSVGLGGKT
jgi:DNA polymerase alpha-associated DNA helicase A